MATDKNSTTLPSSVQRQGYPKVFSPTVVFSSVPTIVPTVLPHESLASFNKKLLRLLKDSDKQVLLKSLDKIPEGWNINQFDCDSRLKEKLLGYVSCAGKLELVKHLVENGVAITLDKIIKSPLHCAAENGHYAVAEYLIKKCPESINKKVSNGSTPLHFAVREGHLEIVKLLVQNNANISAKLLPFEGRLTPLDLAKQNKNQAIIDYLNKKIQDLINEESPKQTVYETNPNLYFTPSPESKTPYFPNNKKRVRQELDSDEKSRSETEEDTYNDQLPAKKPRTDPGPKF